MVKQSLFTPKDWDILQHICHKLTKNNYLHWVKCQSPLNADQKILLDRITARLEATHYNIIKIDCTTCKDFAMFLEILFAYFNLAECSLENCEEFGRNLVKAKKTGIQYILVIENPDLLLQKEAILMQKFLHLIVQKKLMPILFFGHDNIDDLLRNLPKSSFFKPRYCTYNAC